MLSSVEQPLINLSRLIENTPVVTRYATVQDVKPSQSKPSKYYARLLGDGQKAPHSPQKKRNKAGVATGHQGEDKLDQALHVKTPTNKRTRPKGAGRGRGKRVQWNKGNKNNNYNN